MKTKYTVSVRFQFIQFGEVDTVSEKFNCTIKITSKWHENQLIENQVELDVRKILEQLPEDQKFDELTVDNLEYIKDNLDEDENIAILFDDMGAYLKNNETRKLLKEMIMNRRHYHISIYFLVQTWYSIEKDVRKLFSNLFIFKCSRHEMLNITSEMIEQHNDKINEIVKIVYDKPHNFLFINVDSQKMFRGFDELIFNEDE
jgi:hypothetical protein